MQIAKSMKIVSRNNHVKKVIYTDKNIKYENIRPNGMTFYSLAFAKL